VRTITGRSSSPFGCGSRASIMTSGAIGASI
jgi:hypothetical protein